MRCSVRPHPIFENSFNFREVLRIKIRARLNKLLLGKPGKFLEAAV